MKQYVLDKIGLGLNQPKGYDTKFVVLKGKKKPMTFRKFIEVLRDHKLPIFIRIYDFNYCYGGEFRVLSETDWFHSDADYYDDKNVVKFKFNPNDPKNLIETQN